MPWNLPSGPQYSPPPSVAGVLSQGLGSMGDRLKMYADRKREEQRIAMLDQRTSDWRAEDLKIGADRYADSRADSLFDDQMAYGLVPVGSSPAPTLGSRIVAGLPSTTPNIFEGRSLASPALGPQNLPAIPQGGSLASAPSLVAPSAPSAPAAPARRTVTRGGQTFEVDPSQSHSGLLNALQRTQGQEDATAERLRVFGEAQRAAVAAGASEGEALAYATEQANGFQPFEYAPRTRDDKIDYQRDVANATRAPAQPAQITYQRIPAAEGGGVFNPRTGETIGGGAPSTVLTADQRASRQQATTALASLDNYESIVNDYLSQGQMDRGFQRIGGGDRALVGQVEAARNALLLDIKSLAGLGVLSGTDVELVTEMVGDPVTWKSVFTGGGDAAARIAEARKYIENKAGVSDTISSSVGPTREAAAQLPGGTGDPLLRKYNLIPR